MLAPEIVMPLPAVYVVFVSTSAAGAQSVPFHFRTCPLVAPCCASAKVVPVRLKPDPAVYVVFVSTSTPQVKAVPLHRSLSPALLQVGALIANTVPVRLRPLPLLYVVSLSAGSVTLPPFVRLMTRVELL